MRRGAPLGTLAVLPAAAVWAVWVVTGFPLNLFEGGVTLQGGERVVEGQVLYADFFAFYGPLTYALPTAALHLTGSALVALSLAHGLVALASAWVTHRLTARLTDRPVLALAAPLATALLTATTARTLPPLCAVLCLVAAERTGRRRWLVATGAWGAVGLLWVQDGGAWLALAVLLVALSGVVSSTVRRVLGPRQVGLVVLGGVLVTAPVAAYLAVAGALDDWLYYCFVFPNTAYTGRSATGYLTGLVESWEGLGPFTLAYKVTFYLLPYAVVALVAVAAVLVSLRRLRRDADLPVSHLVLALYAVLQLRVLAASLDEAKLIDTSAPVVVCAFALALPHLHRPPEHRTARRRLALVVAVAVTAWCVVWPLQVRAHAIKGSGRGEHAVTAPGLPVGPIGPPDATVAELDDLVATIQERTRPGDPILVLPTQPLLYVLADRPNPTRFDYLDPVYITPDRDQAMARVVAAGEPRLVVVATNTFAGTDRTGGDIAPTTYEAITARYEVVLRIGPWMVMEPVS